MNEISITKKMTYTIHGLTFLDVEMIVMGLDGLDERSMIKQRDKLIKIIEVAL